MLPVIALSGGAGRREAHARGLELHRGLEPLPTVYKTVALPVVLMKRGGVVWVAGAAFSIVHLPLFPETFPCKVFAPELTLSEKPYYLIIHATGQTTLCLTYAPKHVPALNFHHCI